MTEQVLGPKVIYPELSYQVIGAAFAVFNEMGFGHREIYYQRAFAEELKKRNITFEREKRIQLMYRDAAIGHYQPDFLVGEKLVVELKVRPKIGYTHIKQVVSYLLATGLKLAIVIYFTRDGVKYRRIINDPSR